MMKKVFTVLMAAALVLVFSSCSLVRNAGRLVNAVKSAVVDETGMPGVTVSFETAVPGDNSAGDNIADSWPKDIPTSIPMFNSGSFQKNQMYKTESSSSVTYSLRFAGVKVDDVKSYGVALKNAGLDIYTQEGSNMYSVTGMLQGKNSTLTVSAYWEGTEGTCSLMISMTNLS